MQSNNTYRLCVNDVISECVQQVAEKIVNQSRGRLSWLNCQLSSAC